MKIAFVRTVREAEKPLEPYRLEQLIIHFPEVVARAGRERAPHHVAQFLTELAAGWNSFYASEQILARPRRTSGAWRAFARTMENDLWLAGIPAPERM